MEEFVIHLGNYISPHIFQHNVGKDEWDRKMLVVKDQLHIPLTESNHEYTIYQHNEIMYEFNQQQKMVCISDSFDKIEEHQSHHALQYIRTRYNYQFDFLPITDYFNVHTLYRTTYQNENIRIIFEKYDSNYEIFIITDINKKTQNADLINSFI